ncbi:MAG: Amidophosphoribosyltransferase, partial [uncultured Solirubrobacterales bacterium]
ELRGSDFRAGRAARRVRCLRPVRTRLRGRATRLLRALRASAPRSGVGRDRHERRVRPHHDPARPRPRLTGLRRVEAAGARRRHGPRTRSVLDHGLIGMGERPADLPLRPSRARARPQREPDQRRRPSRRAERRRGPAALDLRLRADRRADLDPRGRNRRGRRRRGRPAARGRTLDRDHDPRRRRRLPRPARPAPALARPPRRPLLRRLRELRLRHHRRRAGARGRAGRDDLAVGAWLREPSDRPLRPPGLLRLRAHLLRPARLGARGRAHPGRPAAHGGGPRARGAGRGRRRGRRARLGEPGRSGLLAGLRHPARRRADQEPLRRPHVHPAGSGAAQARPADEVQSAARGRRRPARGRGRRLDRARKHDTADRRDAARRRRHRGPPAHLRAGHTPPVPLRHRHVDAAGDDRPRANCRGGGRGARLRLAGLSVARGRLRGRRRGARHALRRLLHGRLSARAQRRGERQVRARGACGHDGL